MLPDNRVRRATHFFPRDVVGLREQTNERIHSLFAPERNDLFNHRLLADRPRQDESLRGDMVDLHAFWRLSRLPAFHPVRAASMDFLQVRLRGVIETKQVERRAGFRTR